MTKRTNPIRTLLTLLAIVALVGMNSPASAQTFQHVRNATSRLTFAGKTFLIDPMLAPKGEYPGFPDTANEELRNPLVDLPYSIDEALRGVDAILVTHTHLDHWDDVAQKVIDKSTPVLVQNTADAQLIRSQGFTNVYIIGTDQLPFAGIRIHNVRGQHGTQQMLSIEPLAKAIGETIGVVFEAKGQKTVYFAGDTIWTNEVSQALSTYRPKVIVLNTGNAMLKGFDDSIIMGTADVARAAKEAPKAKVVAVHMDAINHCVLSRAELKAFVQKHKLHRRVLIPADGETLKL